jgi:hypothetical protein
MRWFSKALEDTRKRKKRWQEIAKEKLWEDGRHWTLFIQ